MHIRHTLILIAWLLTGLICSSKTDNSAPLLTVAERSEYRETARHAEVVEFCQKLAQLSPLVRVAELGKTNEGRALPVLLLADPPVESPEEAAKSGKLVVLAFGNIHAGEVCGKEALLMLARDLALEKDRPLLKHLILAFVPNLNADGNDRISAKNRPDQAGPAGGVGIRANAQGLDLNRDFVKLESPEIRALVQFFNRWDPAMVIDTHATNGSFHRYTITYDAPRHPAADAKLVELAQEKMLGDLTQRLEKRGGWKSFFYGNFTREHDYWETYPAEPRFGIQYVGLRNRLAILSEAYAYAPYKDRVLATRDFVRVCFDFAADNKDALKAIFRNADEHNVRAGSKPTASDKLALRHKDVPWPNRFEALGYVEEEKNGRHVSTGRPKEYSVFYLGRCQPTLEVQRSFAYLLPANMTKVVQNLQRHGILLETLKQPADLALEVYRVEKISQTSTPYQIQRLRSVDAKSRVEKQTVPAGTVVVRTGQPLGTLAGLLLEPQAEDGLTAWGFFDADLREGRDFPITRLASPVELSTERLPASKP